MLLEISKNTRIAVLLSPLVIILIGFVTATIFSRFINEWAWIPLALVYWTSLALCIAFFKGNKRVKDWLKKSKPSKLSISLALIFGLFPMSILIMNVHLLDSPLIIVLWVAFALINPWFEELYWRGLLLDAAIEWFPKWISVGYSTLFFMLSHPLMWGVFSIANSHYHVFINLLLLGIVWSVIYFKTRSLRWAIFSHFLVNIGIMTVPVFLNIYVPPM
ncbi:CPBP family intramembrane glutamic endopeptidase [Jeotgalibacillus aurantiacus]|uniref:CPBP family intramembrane glutamic endopeptidase n=1 Tax=Jeotgalibacillus aurantiacus TaxID=2763266 RepID=UPI001D0B65EB|nr:CPBP family intramembrane glutamic endopeptidase [Jeotgalibacillus aurantiacus]